MVVIAGQSLLDPEREAALGQVYSLAEYIGDVELAKARAADLLTEVDGGDRR
ncbi:MAG: hypothetical protein QM703_19105 [Gemmatales bacterium]